MGRDKHVFEGLVVVVFLFGWFGLLFLFVCFCYESVSGQSLALIRQIN